MFVHKVDVVYKKKMKRRTRSFRCIPVCLSFFFLVFMFFPECLLKEKRRKERKKDE